jgi:hypothetical protein
MRPEFSIGLLHIFYETLLYFVLFSMILHYTKVSTKDSGRKTAYEKNAGPENFPLTMKE